ncbi:MAG: hypothetical protein WED11_12120 [Natronospirillum sp.]
MDLYLTIFLVLVAIVLIGAMGATQVRYKRQMVNRERLLHLSTENKKLQSLLRSLPGSYLSRELRDFIYRTQIVNLKQMMDLDKGQSKFLQADLDTAIEQRQAVQLGQLDDTANDHLSDIEQANGARAGLKALYQYIKTAFEQRQLQKEEAQLLLTEIEHRLLETGADFYAARGEHAYKQKRYKEAMSLWRKSMETYVNSRLAGQYQRKINAARNRIRKIQQDWKELNRERNDAQARAMQKQMDDWAAEQDEWKKKQVYDDN